ncbi:hypothetical protein V1264_023915 [Littorina saxatilis]|uniref:Ig-like domain-containing protein n=1 Tax=Littorina saxatilis TaxID=31220 RepID=A0AAN9B826_9CAEN
MTSSKDRQLCSEKNSNSSVQISRLGQQQRDQRRARVNARNLYRFLFGLRKPLSFTIVLTVSFYILAATATAVEVNLIWPTDTSLGKSSNFSCTTTLKKPVILDRGFPSANFPARINRYRGIYRLHNDQDRWKLLEQRVTPTTDDKTTYTAVNSLLIEAEDLGVRMDCIVNRQSDNEANVTQSNIIDVFFFATPVIEGPRAVLVGTQVTWSCVVPNVTYRQRDNLKIYWRFKGGSPLREGMGENGTGVPGTNGNAHRVVSNATMRISGENPSFAVMCEAQLRRPNITKTTDYMPVKVFYISDPVLTGPGEVDMGDSRTWTCSVTNVSFHQKGDFVLNWFVNGLLQLNSMINTKITTKANGSSFYTPLRSVSSTLSPVLKRPFCLMCVVRNVVVKEERAATMAVTINGEEAEKCNTTAVGFGTNEENGTSLDRGGRSVGNVTEPDTQTTDDKHTTNAVTTHPKHLDARWVIIIGGVVGIFVFGLGSCFLCLCHARGPAYPREHGAAVMMPVGESPGSSSVRFSQAKASQSMSIKHASSLNDSGNDFRSFFAYRKHRQSLAESLSAEEYNT